jgi:virginiamycin B lyase
MRLRSLAMSGLTVGALAASLLLANTLRAQSQLSDALTGHVSSAAEGSMEGVIVSAKGAGSTITVSVVSDASGRYHFPASKLAPGQYALSVRAAGYRLASTPAATVVAKAGTRADLKLVKASLTETAAQMSDAEWLASMPGTEAQKDMLVDCDACHSVKRIVNSHFTVAEWKPVLARMLGNYVYNASPLVPQRRVPPRVVPDSDIAPLAEYLATVNLSAGSPWKYPLKTLPRPKGDATHVIMTEYDLPRPSIMPHDVVTDARGIAWYTDFGQPFLGELDPKTGKVIEHHIPELKPTFPKGSNDLELDKDGNLWIGMLQQSGVAEFNTKTNEFKTWALSPVNDRSSIAMVTPPSSVDGRMWTNDESLHGMHRLDPATGKWENFGPLKTPEGREIGTYGLFADPQNNGYVLDYALGFTPGRYIVRVDAQTGAPSTYPVSTVGARLRRGRVDNRGYFWAAEYQGNKVARFDLTTKTYRELAMPTPYTFPYDVVRDKNGDVWTGSMWTDRVVRFNPDRAGFVEYLLPHQTNIRRVFIDNSTKPVTFWTGNNLGASIVKLEPAK